MSSYKPIVPEPLTNQVICLTGFSGFIGRHLLDTLVGAGVRPFLIGRPGSTIEPVDGADVAARWDSPADLAKQLAELADPVLLNIAGYFVSRHMPADIAPLISGNLEFPTQIFEALMLSGHSRIINVGTSWEYSDRGAAEPANLYAQLKAANAQTLEWYARQSPIQGINLKLNDTYGGDDTRPKLMPLIKKSWIAGRPAKLRYWAQQINFLHITDVIEGLLAAALHTSDVAANTTETAFLLSNETIKLGLLTDLLCDEIAPGLDITFENIATEDPKLRGVWDEAPRLPNWSPRIKIAEGMADYFGMDL